MDRQATVRRDLLALAARLGDERRMAIAGEGNVSGRIDERRFLVKASGTQLGTLQPDELVEVQAAPVLEALREDAAWSDADADQLLLDARVDPQALKPSVETLFHAWLLQLPGVAYVGHVHAVAVNQVLCSPAAPTYASRRLFPDQVVYCGAESVLIPYVDPGRTLARAIAREVDAFRERRNEVPRTILLENHGIIATGEKYTDVAAALAMAEKAARIFVGAASLGGPIFMEDDHVRRIDGRQDEAYRRRMMREG